MHFAAGKTMVLEGFAPASVMLLVDSAVSICVIVIAMAKNGRASTTKGSEVTVWNEPTKRQSTYTYQQLE